MPVKQALLVIDVQTGMFTLPVPLFNGQNLIQNIMNLISKAQNKSVQIIYMQHCGKKDSLFEEGTPGWKLHPAIIPQENDIIIKKKHSDAFYQTNLEAILKEKCIEELIICGIATEGCIDTTIRRAFSMDFRVITISNCHSTTDNKILKAKQVIDHHNQMFQFFSTLKTSEEFEFNQL
jgi:nicotinamidase-related amidase